ncbi:MAG: AmmeMemoRadiSam system protein B [Syntrophaceae bacterium]
MAGNIRKSVIAGSWYPGNAGTLRREIQKYLDRAEPPHMEGKTAALVSPHAGYVYSGPVAAFGYKVLRKGEFERVIIVGPSHRAYFRGAAVYGEGGFETPLGIVESDAGLSAGMAGYSAMIRSMPDAHAQEHSIEIQLPFLQVVLGEFRFVPVLMGDQSRATCEAVVNAINPAVSDGKTLLVASSDLSHYRPYDSAVKIDRVVLERIERMDADGLLDDLESGRAEACGGGPIAVAIMVAKSLNANTGTVLKYANSGDVSGDRSGVVGYVSAAFARGM